MGLKRQFDTIFTLLSPLSRGHAPVRPAAAWPVAPPLCGSARGRREAAGGSLVVQICEIRPASGAIRAKG